MNGQGVPAVPVPDQSSQKGHRLNFSDTRGGTVLTTGEIRVRRLGQRPQRRDPCAGHLQRGAERSDPATPASTRVGRRGREFSVEIGHFDRMCIGFLTGLW